VARVRSVCLSDSKSGSSVSVCHVGVSECWSVGESDSESE
jgi:hypothetical protein